jgi:uncharacterized damage-inducible protein DinB
MAKRIILIGKPGFLKEGRSFQGISSLADLEPLTIRGFLLILVEQGGEMKDSIIRQNLVELLRGGHAHLTPEQALNGLEPAMRRARPANNKHSVWENLEHMRLAQEDILRYTIDASWVSPDFPEGYWPKETGELTEEAWAASVASFFADLEEVVKLAEDQTLDLTAEIPHGGGQTYLREILLVADHNAYHLGQIVQIRKALGAWG